MTTALIVDDSKLSRMVMGRALEELRPEWKRLEASNSVDAMVIIASRAIDAVLIDYNMPGKTGMELLAEIRATHPSMPGAIVTANIQDEIIAEAKSLAAQFVSKPISAENLRSFLDSVGP